MKKTLMSVITFLLLVVIPTNIFAVENSALIKLYAKATEKVYDENDKNNRYNVKAVFGDAYVGEITDLSFELSGYEGFVERISEKKAYVLEYNPQSTLIEFYRTPTAKEEDKWILDLWCDYYVYADLREMKYDGNYHRICSEEFSFAEKDGVEYYKTNLLEPVSKYIEENRKSSYMQDNYNVDFSVAPLLVGVFPRASASYPHDSTHGFYCLITPKGLINDKKGLEKFGIKYGSFNGMSVTNNTIEKSAVSVIVDGKPLVSAVAPYIENNRTMGPLRAVAEAFGFSVDWIASEKKITLTNEEQTIIMFIGQKDFSINGAPAQFGDAIPTIKDGSTFLPMSKLAEVLGIDVSWDGSTKTATFSRK